jgi:hypothetical protein
MEDGMRLWRILLFTVLVTFCATKLQARPQVIIHDPRAPATSVGLSFTFMSDSSGGGVLSFTNASGVDWFDLFVFVPAPQSMDAIACGGDSFALCVVLPGQFGYFATVGFEGGPGITNGQVFFADLGPSGWTPDAQFLAIANYVPEPGTIVLLMGGIVSILVRRRLT